MKAKNLPIMVADDMESGSASDRRRSDDVKAFATSLARRLRAPVDLVHVEDLSSYPVEQGYYRPIFEGHIKRQEQRLRKLAGGLDVPTRAIFLEGFPVEALLAHAHLKPGSEMIAVGTHARRGLSRVLVGSVAEEIIRNAKVPVLSVGPQARKAAGRLARGRLRILVATELSANSRRAEAYAVSLAKRLGAELVLHHCLYEGFHPVLQTAFAMPSNARELEDVSRRLKLRAQKALDGKTAAIRKQGIACEVSLDTRAARAADSILKAAKERGLALLILGTHGRNLLSGAFLGSTARQVIAEAPMPVITVRSRG